MNHQFAPLPEETFGDKFAAIYWPTSDRDAALAEQQLLNRVQTPIMQNFVDIGQGNHINTISVGSHTSGPARTMVMTHGFAAGLGLWYNNLDRFAAIPGLKVFAIDWLGMGRSSRPKFPSCHAPETEAAMEEAENFFVESLEQWRISMNIERFTLFGHSLGGYLSAAYALKHPEHVDNLILVSPAGVGRKPENHWSDKDDLPAWAKIVRWGWNQNITPQSLIRLTGRFGPDLVKRYVTARFRGMPEDEIQSIEKYGYHVNVRPASGEYALNTVLTLGAFARRPLVDRLSKLAPHIGVHFIYGDSDWMDANSSKEASQLMQNRSKTTIISKAGHHLYLDNPDEFNRVIASELRSDH